MNAVFTYLTLYFALRFNAYIRSINSLDFKLLFFRFQSP